MCLLMNTIKVLSRIVNSNFWSIDIFRRKVEDSPARLHASVKSMFTICTPAAILSFYFQVRIWLIGRPADLKRGLPKNCWKGLSCNESGKAYMAIDQHFPVACKSNCKLYPFLLPIKPAHLPKSHFPPPPSFFHPAPSSHPLLLLFT